MGNWAGSREAFSSAARNAGTLRENSAVLEPPEPIHPSAIAAARRIASGGPPPSQIGGWGFCPGLGAPGAPPGLLEGAPAATLAPPPRPLDPSAPFGGA